MCARLYTQLTAAVTGKTFKIRQFTGNASKNLQHVISYTCLKFHEPKNTAVLSVRDIQRFYFKTSGYARMVHCRGCNPHRCTTFFANLEITSLWRHNSETIRDRQKRRPHWLMKSSELSNGENRIALRQLLQNRKLRHWSRHNLGSRWKLQKMARENFSIRVLYNVTKNQHNPIKTIGRDSFFEPQNP